MKKQLNETKRMQQLAGLITENLSNENNGGIPQSQWKSSLINFIQTNLTEDIDELDMLNDILREIISDNEEEINDPNNQDYLSEDLEQKLTGDVDFRYKDTLRLSFDEPVYGDLDTEEGELQKDNIDSRLYKLLKDVSSGEIDLDWRDDSEVEIHGIDQNKFYKKYDNNFISLI